MKYLSFAFLLLMFFNACYTRPVSQNKPGSYSSIMGREFCVPVKMKYPFYDNVYNIFGHWVSVGENYGLYIRKENDSLVYDGIKNEFVFYNDGSLDWLFIRDNGYNTIEHGKWGVNKTDPKSLKVYGTTVLMRAIYKITYLSKDTLKIENTNYYQQPEPNNWTPDFEGGAKL